jgi:hypothetical protein
MRKDEQTVPYFVNGVVTKKAAAFVNGEGMNKPWTFVHDKGGKN